MKFRVILVLASLICHPLLKAQPEPKDVGAFILQIYVKNDLYHLEKGKWINRSRQSSFANEPLTIHHFILDDKKKVKQELLNPIDPSGYQMVEPVQFTYALFLPPSLKGKPAPNQRLELVCTKDTMIIDFLGVPDRSIFRLEKLQAIHFNPGYYTFHFAGNAQLTPKNQEEAEQLSFAHDLGITPKSEPILRKYGMLSYSPPRDIQTSWKYISPEIRIDQRTPFSVTVRLKGIFQGAVTQQYITEKVVNVFYKVEVLKSGQWMEYPHGPGLGAPNNDAFIDTRVMLDHGLVQFISVDAPPGLGMGIPVGTYRITVLSDDAQTLTSQPFTLGMVDSNPDNPYQILFRDTTLIPHFKLDYYGDIYIQTACNPIVEIEGEKSVPVYHFNYFDALTENRSFGEHDPEDRYTTEFNAAVRSKKLYINNKAYTGSVKYAFATTHLHVANQQRLVYDLIAVKYENGMCVGHEILHDVNPLTEERLIRDY